MQRHISDAGNVLSKVLEYCTFHVEAEAKDDDDKPRKSDEEIKSFDNEYMRVDQSTLYDLILVSIRCYGGRSVRTVRQAANYLNIAPLLDLCCQTVAYLIKGK